MLGPAAGAYDLATNFRNGRVTMEGVFHFLSDVNIRFVTKSGENFATGTTLADAALEYVERMTQDEVLVQECIDRVGT